MKIDVIASGSKGNCYRIDDGKTALLLEAGIPIKEIQIALNFKLSKLAGCLISHRHNDHCKAVKDLIKMGVDVYAPADVFKTKNIKNHKAHAVEPLQQFELGTFAISPFECQHDVVNYGYQITSTHTGERLLFFTDSYYIKYRFTGLTHIMAECNYSMDALNASIEAGYVPAESKKRLMKSHMSIDHFIDFLRANDVSAVRQIYLLHMSDNNSRAAEFKREIQKITGTEVYFC